MKNTIAKQVDARRSTVLSLPPWLVFLVETIKILPRHLSQLSEIFGADQEHFEAFFDNAMKTRDTNKTTLLPSIEDKLKQTGQNPAQVFNSRCGWMCVCLRHAITLISYECNCMA
jgi:hypothetical protein